MVAASRLKILSGVGARANRYSTVLIPTRRVLPTSLVLLTVAAPRSTSAAVSATIAGLPMADQPILRLGSVKDLAVFRDHVAKLGLDLPCDDAVLFGDESPLAEPADVAGLRIGNRWTIHPMEGWDGTPDGRPGEATTRRWAHFGKSGAKLIWGGEAVAVRHEGRANPNQLLINENTKADLGRLREVLVAVHRQQMGSDDGLVVGLQLTHSGRYSKPNDKQRMEPRILFRHPILDRRLKLGPDYPLLGDGDVRSIIED